jgi:hypothetical protein
LLNLATVLQQQLQDRAGALQRYREYLTLQPRDENWEAVNAIVRSLEPAPVASVRSPPSKPVVTTTVSRSGHRSSAASHPAEDRSPIERCPNARDCSTGCPGLLKPAATHSRSRETFARASH